MDLWVIHVAAVVILRVQFRRRKRGAQYVNGRDTNSQMPYDSGIQVSYFRQEVSLQSLNIFERYGKLVQVQDVCRFLVCESACETYRGIHVI